MIVLKILGAVVIAVLAIFVIGGFLLSSSYHVERTVQIAAPAEAVHAYVGDLARWEAWTPWKEVDPTIVVELGEQTTGVGAYQRWTGESGTGELTFTECSAHSGVAYDMSFDEGKFESVGAIAYAAVEGGTEVTWTMDGDVGSNLVGRWMGLMMDEWVGKDFENGLTKLKGVVEGGA